MNQPILPFVVERLAQWKGRWPAVAESTGISLRTIEKIAREETKDPRVGHVQRLHDWFRAQDDAA